MNNKNDGNDEKSGIKVVDRRLKFDQEGERDTTEDKGMSGIDTGGGKNEVRDSRSFEETIEIGKKEPPIPEPNFINFILSLWTTANLHMGYIKSKEDKDLDIKVDLSLAKHTIDTIDMLKAKTEGNRTDEEEELIKNILYDLKMKFVKRSSDVDKSR